MTSWAPTTNNPVRALAVGPDGVYVGGDFSTINGSAASFLGKVDATGALVWNGNAVGGSVLSLALSGDSSTLYAGGAFTQPRRRQHAQAVRRGRPRRPAWRRPASRRAR